ncbi:MAG: nucleoside hydrolase [Actinomycetota bacterium]|jgi:purine nucleosidase|nr:nucleoside hydrolase [Actinomycetota bacterium]MDA8359056.1 nucleoside hydrolase [Actinomycetota bacterium]
MSLVDPVPTRRQVVLDTDTAADDCFALLACLLHPAADLKAVTVVAGNVSFQQQVENALITIDQSGRGGEVPVFAGCTAPLTRPWRSAAHVHGDGKGGHTWRRPRQRVEKDHAVNAIVTLAERCRGELDLVCIGPLTNVAAALILDRELPSKVRKVYVMGGSNNWRGNITPAAEYNFYADPEAASLVLGAGFDLTIVDWSLTVRQAVFDDAERAAIERLGTPLSHFFGVVNGPTLAFNRRVGIDGSTHPDLLTALCLLEPGIIRRTGRYRVEVETHGSATLGHSVFDWGVLEDPANATVVEEIDRPAFFDAVLTLLAHDLLAHDPREARRE